MHTAISMLTKRASDIRETAGLAGASVAVGGITGNVWWGLLVGSVATVLLEVASSLPPRRPAPPSGSA